MQSALAWSSRFRIGIALLGIAVLVFAWHYFFRLPLVRIHPIEAVSAPVTAILAVPSEQDLASKDNPLLTLAAASENWEKEISATLDFLKKSKLDARRRAEVWVLFQQTGATALTPGFIFDIRGKGAEVEALFSQSAGLWNESRYQGVRIYHAKSAEGGTMSAAQYRNLLLVSRLPIVVESAIAQLASPRTNLRKDAAFRKLGLPDLSGSSLGAVFFNPSGMAALSSESAAKATFLPAQTAEAWQWVRIEAKRKNGGFHLWGTMVAANDNALAVALPGQAQRGDQGDWHAMIPDPVASLFQTRFSNPDAFFRASGIADNRRLKRYLLPCIGQEAIFATLESSSANTPPEQLWVIRSSSEKLATAKLADWVNDEGSLKAYDYQAFKVFQILSESLPAGWSSGRRMRNPCYTIVDDYVVLTSSPAAMERWIDHYTIGKTLAQSASFQQLWQQSNRAANGFCLINAPALGLSFGADAALSTASRRLGLLGFAIEAHGSTFSLNGYCLPDTSQVTESKVLWENTLPHPARTSPAMVETGTPDGYVIAIQDDRNQLHVLDRNGQLLWKKALDGPLLGSIQSVDWYSDRHRQLLFNTPKSIWLLNLDGEVEPNFPIGLKPLATNGLLVTDFEGNGGYSIFVACENGNIYGFDRNNKPLEGWNPLSGAGKVRFPLQHFQRDNKDFLVSLNESGQLLVFKRDGTFRFPPVETLSAFRSPPAVQNSVDQCRIVATDVNGICHVVNAEGLYFRMRLSVGRNEQVAFAFGDMAGNSAYDYAVVSDSSVAVHYYKNKDLSRAFAAQVSAAPDSLMMLNMPNSDKSALGMFNRKSRQVWLLLPDGKMHPDFPLPGTTAFALCDLLDQRQRIVVVANEAKVYACRIR